MPFIETVTTVFQLMIDDDDNIYVGDGTSHNIIVSDTYVAVVYPTGLVKVVYIHTLIDDGMKFDP
jgi:hypothetical protein